MRMPIWYPPAAVCAVGNKSEAKDGERKPPRDTNITDKLVACAVESVRLQTTSCMYSEGDRFVCTSASIPRPLI